MAYLILLVNLKKGIMNKESCVVNRNIEDLIAKNYDIYNKYTDVSPLKLFIKLFRFIPNRNTIRVNLNLDKLKEVLEKKYSSNPYYYYFYIDYSSDHLDRDNEIITDISNCWVLDENLILEYNTHGCGLYIYHRFDNKWFENYLSDLIDMCGGIVENEVNNFNMIININNHLELKPIKPSNAINDITPLFNDDFLPVDEKIRSFLNSKESGIIILHGKQGTGKTSYIRSLISKNTNNEIIYVPSDMMSALSSPGFLTFMLSHENSILILEDCEELLRSRKGSNGINNGLLNILNMSDGLLGDALKIKFICTFNNDIKDIDIALQRKGRLFARYEFKPLCKEKVKVLNEKFNLDIPEQNIKDMTLAEIFNYHDPDYTKYNNVIGL